MQTQRLQDRPEQEAVKMYEYSVHTDFSQRAVASSGLDVTRSPCEVSDDWAHSKQSPVNISTRT